MHCFKLDFQRIYQKSNWSFPRIEAAFCLTRMEHLIDVVQNFNPYVPDNNFVFERGRYRKNPHAYFKI